MHSQRTRLRNLPKFGRVAAPAVEATTKTKGRSSHSSRSFDVAVPVAGVGKKVLAVVCFYQRVATKWPKES